MVEDIRSPWEPAGEEAAHAGWLGKVAGLPGSGSDRGWIVGFGDSLGHRIMGIADRGNRLTGRSESGGDRFPLLDRSHPRRHVEVGSPGPAELSRGGLDPKPFAGMATGRNPYPLDNPHPLPSLERHLRDMAEVVEP